MDYSNLGTCPICNKKTERWNEPIGVEINEFNCLICGEYKIVRTLRHSISDQISSPENHASLSNWIRKNQNHTLDTRNIKSLINLNIPTPIERANNLFVFIQEKLKYVGDGLPIRYTKNIIQSIEEGTLESVIDDKDEFYHSLIQFVPQFYSYSFSYKASEILSLIDDFLVKALGYLEKVEKAGYGVFGRSESWVITSSGWSFINELKQGINSSQGFIAIDFHDDYDPPLRWIKTAITNAGYTPMCLKGYDHNEIIDYEMYLQIKKSKFLIADLSSNNNGSYYEAGYALGLGKELILTCRDGSQTHFDTSHRLLTKWTPDEPEKFIEDLTKRILVTIGAGPIYKPD